MGKVKSSTELTETILLSECTDGFYLYDYTRGMNLSMQADTEREAFTEALTYHQERTKKLETELNVLRKAINTLINTVSDDEDTF